MNSPDLDLAAHAAYLRGLARALLGAGAEADDLVQDTFVAALEHPPRASGLRAWLATVARHRARDLRRGRARRAEREADVARREEQPDDAGAALERLELAQRLASEVARLREPYRTAIYLRYHEGLAPAAIAERLGVPVKTVHTRLSRALEELRARLDARDGGREAWSALLLPLAFPRGALEVAAPAAPLTVALAGGITVKKLALAAATVVLGVLVLKGALASGLLGLRRADQVASISNGPRALEPAPLPASVPPAEPPRTPLEPERAAGVEAFGRLVVTLTRGPAGAPVPDACVDVESYQDPAPRPDVRHGRTDEQGRARFERLPAGETLVMAPTGAVERISIRAGEELEVRLDLGQGLSVEGRVVATDGQPVAGARILVLMQRWPEGPGHEVARSRADGGFRLDGLREDVHVSAVAAGWTPSLALEPAAMPVSPDGARLMLLELREPGGGVAGRVLDSAGAPVADAVVTIGPSGGGIHDLPSGLRAYAPQPALLMTAQDGTFELLGDLLPGWQPVDVVAEGHPVWFGGVQVQEGQRAWLEVTLERPARVRGRVLDASGAPRSGARVTASREVGARRYLDRTPIPLARTDERGEFQLDWVPSGEVEIAARMPDDEAAGRARARLTCAPGELREVELALDPEPAIHGRVVDAEGHPLAGWRVHSRTSSYIEMSALHPSAMSTLGGVRSTDADGHFLVPNADDLAWDLSVAAPGEFPFPPRAERKGVRAGALAVELVVANVNLQPCGVLARLVGEDGRPPQDIVATLWDEPRTAGIFAEYDPATGVVSWSMTLPGRYRVQVRRGARVVYDGDLVDLRPGETVDLGLLLLGEPGGLAVEVSAPEGWNLEHVQVGIVRAGGSEELRLEQDGSAFRAQGVAPGSYVLRAGHKALFAAERELEVRPGEDTRLEIDLVPALPVEVTFEFPAAAQEWSAVDWEVQDPTGLRLSGGRVRNWREFGGTAAPGIRGLGLPVGRYTLVATSDTGLRAELALDVADPRAARGPHALAFRP